MSEPTTPKAETDEVVPDWQRRIVDRSLESARVRSIDRGSQLIRAAATVLERTNGESLTVQEVADVAGQSLRTLYQYFASKDDLLLAVYEESMRVYAKLIDGLIAKLDDPIERLAGGVIVAARMPAMHGTVGVDRGLSHLRLHLGQSEPELIARSQEPVTLVFRSLVEAALAAQDAPVLSVEAGTYFVSSARTGWIVSSTLGNEYAVELPGVIDLSFFCLSGLGFDLPRDWHEDVDRRLELPTGEGRSILRALAKG
jgi:AcrR family transcriptional regulator